MSSVSDIFPSVVTVAPRISRDSYGVVTTGTPVPYVAKIRYKQDKILSTNGEEIVITGSIYFKDDKVAISMDDVVTLPDGRSPIIVGIVRGTGLNKQLSHLKVQFV